MTPRFAVLWLSLASLAAASAACSASDTLAPAGADTVVVAVTDGADAVSQAASDAAAQIGLSNGSKPPSSGARAGARTRPSAAGRRSRAHAEAGSNPSSGAPQDVVPGEGAEPGVALDESASRESVHEAPPVLAAAQASQAAPAAAAPGLVRSDRIYSEADPDVTPAVLLTTKEGGPIFQGVQGSVNTMELVISREGRVETVRLLTPPIRMTDMLLLSGAKTWKFAPALKDGQPVRYRTRFSWESTP